jgi:hypothetical protein
MSNAKTALTTPQGPSPLVSPTNLDREAPQLFHASSLPTRSLLTNSNNEGRRDRSRSPTASDVRQSDGGSFGLMATVRGRSRSPTRPDPNRVVDSSSHSFAASSDSGLSFSPDASSAGDESVREGRDSESSVEHPRKAESVKLNTKRLMTFNAFCQDIWKSCEKKFSAEDDVPIDVQLEITEEFINYPSTQLNSAVNDESFRSELIKKISNRDFSRLIDQPLAVMPNVIVTSPRSGTHGK